MSLSFSMEANKGVYALLLGSGISYTASIPTGWGILKLLCSRIMKLEGEEHPDEIQWYTDKFGKEPLYDEIIGMLAKTPSERNGLLSEFFEPTTEDLQEGRKVPTEAHRSIANLVKGGHIKVIVTTNFDRLLEQSLDELSVQYQTLYHDSDIEGMKPLAHAECTVLKIHGDYRDTRFRNITDELSSYPAPVNELLNRVFDEYGLIVSGWSAEWDTALRDVIRSVKGRRYSWYWHSFNEEPGEQAKELVKFRDGTVIADSQGADHFFRELKENVLQIKEMKKVHPDNLQVRVKRLKSYIYHENESAIRDLITRETRDLLSKLNEMSPDQEVRVEILNEWLIRIKELTKPISILISVLAYYGKTEAQNKLLIETLERLTNLQRQSGNVLLVSLKYVPLQTVLYSIGISLVMSKKYNMLNDVFTKPKLREREHDRQNFAMYISPRREWREALEILYPNNRKFLPFETLFLNPYIEEIFTENQLAFDSNEFNIYYDLFEFLRSIKARHQKDLFYFTGCFGYKYDRRNIENFVNEGYMEENWGVLSLFENSKEIFAGALSKLAEDLEEHFNYSGHGLIESIANPK